MRALIAALCALVLAACGNIPGVPDHTYFRMAEPQPLPVSTTQVLSSGVAGTMAANRSGLQWQTVRHLALAWVLTLPASIVLAGSLFWVFRHFA